MGLEVAIAKVFTCANVPCGSHSASACICKMQQGLSLPWRLSVCCFVFYATAVQWKLSSMQIPLSFETKRYLPLYSMHLLLFCFIFVFIYAVVLHLQNRCLFYAKTWPTLKHNSTSTAPVSIVQPSQTVTVSYVSGTVVLCVTLFKTDVSWTAFCTAQVSQSPVLLSAILCLLLVRKLGFLPALFTSHTKMLDLCGADHACKRPSGCWKSKNRTGRFPSCLDKTDTNLLLQSHCKKEHVHHTAWTLGTTAWLQSSSFFPCIFYHFLFCSFDSVVVPYYGEAFPIFNI